LRPAGIILLFVVLAFLCKRFDIGKYRSLPDASRLVFVCHNAFFLIFLTTAIPYSIALVKVLFAPTAPLPLLQSSMYRCMSFPLALQVGMYVLEVSKQWNMCQGYIMLQQCRLCSPPLESLHKHASNKATTKLPVSVLLPDSLAG